MTKYRVKVWYTVSRFKEVDIEAEDAAAAEQHGQSMIESEDTDGWEEHFDSSVDIDVEELE